jgi:hypothetical protein
MRGCVSHTECAPASTATTTATHTDAAMARHSNIRVQPHKTRGCGRCTRVVRLDAASSYDAIAACNAVGPRRVFDRHYTTNVVASTFVTMPRLARRDKKIIQQHNSTSQQQQQRRRQSTPLSTASASRNSSFRILLPLVSIPLKSGTHTATALSPATATRHTGTHHRASRRARTPLVHPAGAAA